MFHFFVKGKMRLLTAEDEVTNTLMDKVARYINEPLHLHFAIEQLSLRWENVFAKYRRADAQQVRREKNKEPNFLELTQIVNN